MKYEKNVKVYKQGGTSINLPTAFCDMLNIKPGSELKLTLDTNNNSILISKKPVSEIFKIQKSLFEDDENSLIYNKDRSIVFIKPFKDFKYLFKNEVKIYVNAFYKNKNLQIIERVEDQNW